MIFCFEIESEIKLGIVVSIFKNVKSKSYVNVITLIVYVLSLSLLRIRQKKQTISAMNIFNYLFDKYTNTTPMRSHRLRRKVKIVQVLNRCFQNRWFSRHYEFFNFWCEICLRTELIDYCFNNIFISRTFEKCFCLQILETLLSLPYQILFITSKSEKSTNLFVSALIAEK